jgi:hypothetical protein
MVVVRWEGSRKKAPAAKTEGNRLQIVRYERFADCALERREPDCEWSKGGRPRAVRHERRGLAHVEVEGWRGFCLLVFRQKP